MRVRSLLLLLAALVPGHGNAVPRFLALDVPGFAPAVLSLPSGAAERPLVVAAHGAGGSPEWECEYWNQLLGRRYYVLCLRGTSLGRGGGYYFKNHHALEAELVAAESAVRRAYPSISREGGLYVGFSQGASMGSAMIAKHGGSFPRLVLIEGYELWNIPRARAFAKSGGERVLFVCGTKSCASKANESARWLLHCGVEARVEHATGGGHTPAGAVGDRVSAGLGWLLAAPR
jgi:predicted esterase